MKITLGRLNEIITSADLTGFTQPLKGKPGRYIVGLTNNTVWSLELLLAQAKGFYPMFTTLTIGGRTNPKNGVVFIDIGTSTDNLQLAKVLGKFYDQQCVYDIQECVDIQV